MAENYVPDFSQPNVIQTPDLIGEYSQRRAQDEALALRRQSKQPKRERYESEYNPDFANIQSNMVKTHNNEWTPQRFNTQGKDAFFNETQDLEAFNTVAKETFGIAKDLRTNLRETGGEYNNDFNRDKINKYDNARASVLNVRSDGQRGIVLDVNEASYAEKFPEQYKKAVEEGGIISGDNGVAKIKAEYMPDLFLREDDFVTNTEKVALFDYFTSGAGGKNFMETIQSESGTSMKNREEALEAYLEGMRMDLGDSYTDSELEPYVDRAREFFTGQEWFNPKEKSESKSNSIGSALGAVPIPESPENRVPNAVGIGVKLTGANTLNREINGESTKIIPTSFYVSPESGKLIIKGVRTNESIIKANMEAQSYPEGSEERKAANDRLVELIANEGQEVDNIEYNPSTDSAMLSEIAQKGKFDNLNEVEMIKFINTKNGRAATVSGYTEEELQPLVNSSFSMEKLKGLPRNYIRKSLENLETVSVLEQTKESSKKAKFD